MRKLVVPVIALLISLAALTLPLATALEQHGHPWLNDQIQLLTGGCPANRTTVVEPDDNPDHWQTICRPESEATR